MIVAHHEVLIVAEYSVLAGGSTFWAVRFWWRNRKQE